LRRLLRPASRRQGPEANEHESGGEDIRRSHGGPPFTDRTL